MVEYFILSDAQMLLDLNAVGNNKPVKFTGSPLAAAAVASNAWLKSSCTVSATAT